MNANSVFFSDEIQLGYALDAFAWAHRKPIGWATANLLRLKSAGIASMSDLSVGCHEETVNLDLELFGIAPRQRLSRETIAALRSFLPGPVGFRCFRLAQMAANKVSAGPHLAVTEYVHRPESGKMGDEAFQIRSGHDAPWILHVDCAGFVRNCVKHTTKDPMVKCLSDRDFMRAKDFYAFFKSLPNTVMDVSDEEYRNGNAPLSSAGSSVRQWRRVDDLRMCIPGDVICYRPRGSAAGGAAFTTNDRKDLIHLLRAIQTARLWHQAVDEAAAEEVSAADGSPSSSTADRNPVRLPPARNYAKDPSVKSFAAETKQNLNSVGIMTVKELHANLGRVNSLLESRGLPPLSDELLKLARECAETTCENTGHIVFCSGPAVDKGGGQYRVRVVHSTKHGRKDENGVVTQGVQEYFRRFTLVQEEDCGGGSVQSYWTREMTGAHPISPRSAPGVGDGNSASAPTSAQTVSDDEGDDDNPNDDMEEDPDDVTDGQPVEEEDDDGVGSGDDLAGQAMVEVVAARMCF
jgi:hypothetical protein